MRFSASPWWERGPTDWDEKRVLFLRNTAVSVSIFRRRRAPTIFVTTFLLGALFYIQHFKPFAPPPRDAHPAARGLFDGTWNFTRDARNLKLSETQCKQAFPNLYVEIDRAVEDRRSNHVTLKETDEMAKGEGFIRAMIYDQQVLFSAPFRGE